MVVVEDAAVDGVVQCAAVVERVVVLVELSTPTTLPTAPRTPELTSTFSLSAWLFWKARMLMSANTLVAADCEHVRQRLRGKAPWAQVPTIV